MQSSSVCSSQRASIVDLFIFIVVEKGRHGNVSTEPRQKHTEHTKGRGLQGVRKGPGTRTVERSHTVVLASYSEDFRMPFMSMELSR